MRLPIFETVLKGIKVVGSLVGTRVDLTETFDLHAAGRTTIVRETRQLDQVNEARQMAEIDPDTYNVVKKVIFGSDSEPNPTLPELGSYEAGVLLEVMKDVLYQSYVRLGKLQQAMMVRRFFVDEASEKVTTIGRTAIRGD